MGLLTELINLYYQKDYKKQTRPMRNKLHPSTIGMCQRRIVFDMLMVPQSIPDSRLLRIFDNGHSLHERYQKIFEEMGILIQAEVPLEFENISGHTDAWIRVFSVEYPMGQDYLVDFKSAFSKSFQWMKSNNQPKKEYYDQLMFYLYLINQMNIPIRKGILLVENKDDQDIWEYEFDYDRKHAEKLAAKANWCIQHALNRTLPPIPPGHTPSYYKCSMCPFNFYCHANAVRNNGEKRYPIPFQFGSKAYVNAHHVINAINNNKPIPDVIVGNTNGELATEVEQHSNMLPQ